MLSLAAAPEDSVRELGRKIAVMLEARETVTLTVRNASSLAPADVVAMRREIESQLRAGGFRLAAEGTASVAVTLAENWQGGVWIAEIRHGDKREVAMVGPVAPTERVAATPVGIDKQLILAQAEPILDALATDDLLLVLTPGEVAIYDRKEARWEIRRAVELPPQAWPRDLRGRLAMEGDAWRAYLPGLVCHGKVQTEAAAECGESEGPWPGGGSLKKGRNYFEAEKLPPYYSAARVGEYTLVAGVDGRTRWIDAAGKAVGSFGGWGSDMVAVETGCGAQVLATRAGEAAETDAVQAFEAAGRQMTAVSGPLEFNGPVTALWPAGPAGAVAISRDPNTGQYAAFRLSLTCSR
jgi:hypothetical protein